MGSDLSQHSDRSENEGTLHQPQHTKRNKVSLQKQIQPEIKSWSEIHRCHIDMWHEIAQPCGFIDLPLTCSGKLHHDCMRNFCIKRQGILHIRGDHVFSFHKRSKLVKMAAHLEYNYLPAQLSALYYYHVRSIVCMRENIIILFLSRAHDCQFAVLDLKRDKYLGVFGTQSGIFAPDQLFGDISPDLTKCIIRMPYAHQPGMDDDTVWYHLVIYSIDMRRRMADLDLRTAFSMFVFNPRHCWQQIAITNFSWAANPVSQNSICVLNIDAWEMVTVNNHVCSNRQMLERKLKDILYTRDSSFIVLSFADVGCFCNDRRSHAQLMNCSIAVLCGNSLTVLHTFEYQRFSCSQHMCPVNYVPHLSLCGTRLALVTNSMSRSSQDTQVSIIRLPVVVNLQALCRTVVVNTYSAKIIPTLPLPQRIVKYLLFTPL